MNITGSFTNRKTHDGSNPYNTVYGDGKVFTTGEYTLTDSSTYLKLSTVSSNNMNLLKFNASKNWTGEKY